jgi:hypothetical protein
MIDQRSNEKLNHFAARGNRGQVYFVADPLVFLAAAIFLAQMLW